MTREETGAVCDCADPTFGLPLDTCVCDTHRKQHSLEASLPREPGCPHVDFEPFQYCGG